MTELMTGCSSALLLVAMSDSPESDAIFHLAYVTRRHTCAGGAGTNAPVEHSAPDQSDTGRGFSTHLSSVSVHHGGPAVSHQRPYDGSDAQGEEQSKRQLTYS